MTALEYVNSLSIKEMNNVYNYLGDINEYHFSRYYIRNKNGMNTYLRHVYADDILSLLRNGYDCDFTMSDKYFYRDFETDAIMSFTSLEEAPYTREDLVRGLEAEVECRAFDTLEDIIEEIETMDF